MSTAPKSLQVLKCEDCKEQPASARVNTCRFLDKQSADTGYFVSAGSDGVVRLWNFSRTSSPLLLHKFVGAHSAGDVLDVSCGDGAVRLASVGVDKAVAIWDVSSGILWGRLHGHDDKINTCGFKDANVLVTGSSDCTLRLWDCRNKNCVQVLPKFKDAVTGATADDSSVAGCSVDGSIRTFDVRTGSLFIDQGDYALGGISRSRDSKCLLVSCVDPSKPTLKILDRSTGNVLQQFQGHVNGTVTISSTFDHEDARVCAGSEDGIVRFWDLVTGSVVNEINVFGPRTLTLEAPMALGVTHHSARPAFVVCGTNGLLQCYTYQG